MVGKESKDLPQPSGEEYVPKGYYQRLRDFELERERMEREAGGKDPKVRETMLRQVFNKKNELEAEAELFLFKIAESLSTEPPDDDLKVTVQKEIDGVLQEIKLPFTQLEFDAIQTAREGNDELVWELPNSTLANQYKSFTGYFFPANIDLPEKPEGLPSLENRPDAVLWLLKAGREAEMIKYFSENFSLFGPESEVFPHLDKVIRLKGQLQRHPKPPHAGSLPKS